MGVARNKMTLCHQWQQVFPLLNLTTLKLLLNFRNQHSELCSVKTIKHDVLIPKGKTMSVTCKANTRSNKTSKLPVLFEPDPEQPWPTGLDINETLTNINGGVSSRVVIQVRNSTDHDIVLPKRTILGQLQLVKSVTPVEVKEKCNKEAQVSEVCEAPTAENNSSSDSSKTHPLNEWLPKVDLSSLTAEQKLIAQQMLREESDCFSRDDEDIGCCE